MMKKDFHTLTIKDLKRETPDCVSVSFEVPERLREQFVFKQGQHLTFRKHVHGREIRRSYSICTSPFDNELRVAVKMLEGGRFSTFINETARKGDRLEVMVPQGGFFTEVDPTHQKNYVAVAAGSGITPIISIVKTILLVEPKSRVTLIFGNRTRRSIIFKETIQALKNQFMERLQVFHVLSRERTDVELFSGRINNKKMGSFLKTFIQPKEVDDVFLCGPQEMIVQCTDAFLEAGVPREKIHFELFYNAEAERKRIDRKQTPTSSQNGPTSKVSIRVDGSSIAFELAYDGEPILEAALRNGADLPYSCMGGVCATCKCKLEEGDVTMDVNYSLEAEELNKGFILACQSHPASEQVQINFDMK